ncbi:MAG TPA: hypothetical protein VMV07_04325 [Streptosporangiaceae bacterium]|nr:hypothetical protein [Streptosporangiaceae bacterium]
MQDSIYPANLTAAADAYLGYVDGNWPTYHAVVARFPGKPVLSMAVLADAEAVGCDQEPGDLSASQVPAWIKRQQARGVERPVVYASASNLPAVLRALAAAGIGRAAVRLLSAHYGAGKHICGPATCAFPGVPACDGTQWTDSAAGAGGALIDESVLNDDFFSGGNMAISSADIAAIAKAVWKIDGVVPGPDANKSNPFWEPQRSLADLGVQVRVIEQGVAALAVKAGADPSTVIAGVLPALNPAQLADVIATSLGPEAGQRVIAALQERLAPPAS